MLWLRALAVWLVLIAVEVLHGIVRSIVVVPMVGDVRARQIGVFSGSAMNLGITCLFNRWMGVRTDRARIGTGVGWVGLTVLFDVAFGRLVTRASWTRVRADYDLARGGLLPLGLVALAASPLVVARLCRVHEG